MKYKSKKLSGVKKYQVGDTFNELSSLGVTPFYTDGDSFYGGNLTQPSNTPQQQGDMQGVDREQYIQMKVSQGFDPQLAAQDWDESNGRTVSNKQSTQSQQGAWNLPPINPGGSSYSSLMYMAGAGARAGAAGQPLGWAQMGTGLASATIGLAGDFLAGAGAQKRNQQVREWYNQQQRAELQPQYERASQSSATNNLGNMYAQEGGEYDMLFSAPTFNPIQNNTQPDDPTYRRLKAQQDQMLFLRDRGSNILRQVTPLDYQNAAPESRVERMRRSNLYGDLSRQKDVNAYKDLEGKTVWKGDNRDFYQLDENRRRVPVQLDTDSLRGFQEGGEQDAMQQMMQGVAQMLSEGASPEQVVESLIQQGLPQEQAVQIVEAVVQQMQGGQPIMKRGGKYQEGGEQDQMQQLMMMVTDALQQGSQPEEVVQMLVQQGIPQEQATQIVEAVIQQMQQPQMQYGGLFDEVDSGMANNTFFGNSVGDYVEFEYGGKMQKGVIKNISNGKITLG